ncbi:uncharacterized protein ATNIH1004_011025 [Aspergillus tanneri]|uniref:Uncharacterized protein n=1 Tax=Aspergillus tanneri TaxID=1220188 RepID=A0A5M9M9T6_9EURO|nr:uncharacterized protein ATNIH1004_011025 [Aspergillus tanneri]KAA8642084.1 hypothetical protein ATNIH1004_011025 [Aspergillus tanneri]
MRFGGRAVQGADRWSTRDSLALVDLGCAQGRERTCRAALLISRLERLPLGGGPVRVLVGTGRGTAERVEGKLTDRVGRREPFATQQRNERQLAEATLAKTKGAKWSSHGTRHAGERNERQAVP